MFEISHSRFYLLEVVHQKDLPMPVQIPNLMSEQNMANVSPE